MTDCPAHDWVLQEGLVRRAQGVLGWRELPGNHGILLDEDLDGKPWCARLVRRLFELCGHPIHGTHSPRSRALLLWVEYMERTFREHHAWRSVLSDYQPCKGDVVFHVGRDASDPGVGRHVSILEAVDFERRVLHTIDGNWGNCVARVEHPWSASDVTGFGWIPL